MIQKRTVLVVGAGGSYDYGFHLGKELKHEIVRLCYEANPFLMMEPGRPDVNEARAFGQALQFSGLESIDTFLQGRPQFLQLGKLAIAYTLLPWDLDSTVQTLKCWI